MNTILKGHIRKRKRLIPPLLNALGGRYAPYSWAQELVPQIAWLSILIERHGFDRGAMLGAHLARAAAECRSIRRSSPFITATSFSRLSKTQKIKLLKTIDRATLKDLRSSLNEYNRLFSRNPINFLSNKRPTISKKNRISARFSKILKELYDRNSRLSVLTMAAAMHLGLSQGKILMAEEMGRDLSDRFRALRAYPDTEASRIAASSFRASAPMVLKGGPDRPDPKAEPWIAYFWRRVAGFGPCKPMFSIEFDDESSEDELESLIAKFRNAAKLELIERLENWGFELDKIEKYEVIGALLARQTTLAVGIASSPTIWTPHLCPILLRAMADVHITLVWILKDPQIRSKRYVDDGLGTVKLEIAHRKAELEANQCDADESAQKAELVRYLQMWIDSQRLDQFIEVNLGNWSGITTRKMAEEADCLDFYNYVYQPFSSAVHSNWWHISDKNTSYCLNPAHRNHRIPTIAPIRADFQWLYLASKYLEKSFAAFDSAQNIVCSSPKAINILENLIEDFAAD